MQKTELRTPSWNFQEAIRKVGNDQEIATAIFLTLIKELDTQILGMLAAIDAKNWVAIEQSAHRLLGSSRICATPKLEHLAAALEYCAKARDRLAASDLLAEMQQEAVRLRVIAHQAHELTE